MGGILSSKGIDALYERGNTKRFTVSSDSVLGGRDEISDLCIRETPTLGLLHEVMIDLVERTKSLDLPMGMNDIFDLVQVPLKRGSRTYPLNITSQYLINLGEIMDAINRVILVVHSMSNGKQPQIRWSRECSVEVLGLIIRFETLPARIDLTNGFLQAFFECTPDSHYFPNTLHGRTNLTVDM